MGERKRLLECVCVQGTSLTVTAGFLLLATVPDRNPFFSFLLIVFKYLMRPVPSPLLRLPFMLQYTFAFSWRGNHSIHIGISECGRNGVHTDDTGCVSCCAWARARLYLLSWSKN